VSEIRVWEVGEMPTVTCLTTDAAGAPADPTTIWLVIETPDGEAVKVTPTHAKDSQGADIPGSFEASFLVTQSGDHELSWDGTGAVTFAAPEVVAVRKRRAPLPGASHDQRAAGLRLRRWAHSDDLPSRTCLRRPAAQVRDLARRWRPNTKPLAFPWPIEVLPFPARPRRQHRYRWSLAVQA